MAAQLDIDKLVAACQEAVSDPAAASKTSTEALLVIDDPLAAAPKTPLAAAAPAPLAAAPKTPPDEVPPWRATPSSATAAKTRPRNPATVHDPRLAKIGNKYALIGSQWQQVRTDRPRSSAAKAGVVFPAVPPAARPVAPSKAGRVAARVVAPPPAKANAPAKARPPVEAVDSCAAPAKAAAPAPAPVETPAPAEAHAPAAAPAKTAAQGVACPFKELGIPRPPPAAVRPVAALAAHVVPVSEPRVVPPQLAVPHVVPPQLAVPKKKHGPRGMSENSQWHTAWHRAKNEGPKALCEFYRAWPKPPKKQKTQRDA